MIVNLLIWIVLFSYLWRIERKIKKLEKR
ncbi:MAG: CcmD family protein [candidate division Zixibacteria bacterium]|nr:CcmD family protein [candidate division Zixibacteria bacterium]